jgi:hypothetical protein
MRHKSNSSGVAIESRKSSDLLFLEKDLELLIGSSMNRKSAQRLTPALRQQKAGGWAPARLKRVIYLRHPPIYPLDVLFFISLRVEKGVPNEHPRH